MLNTIPERKEVTEDPESVLIFGFPGIGKTYAYEHQEELGLTLQDSNSSHFHWMYHDEFYDIPVLDEKGNRVPHPAWPANYAQYIELTGREQAKKPDYIMVSTHEEVMNTVGDLKFKSFTIIPDGYAKQYFLDLYRKRGNDKKFIDNMDMNWFNFIEGTKKRAMAINSNIVLVGPDRKFKSLYDFLKAGPKTLFAMIFDEYKPMECPPICSFERIAPQDFKPADGPIKIKEEK